MHIFKLVVIGHVIHKKGPCTLYSIFCVCECVCLLKAEEIENAMFFVSQFFRKKKQNSALKWINSLNIPYIIIEYLVTVILLHRTEEELMMALMKFIFG